MKENIIMIDKMNMTNTFKIPSKINTMVIGPFRESPFTITISSNQTNARTFPNVRLCIFDNFLQP